MTKRLKTGVCLLALFTAISPAVQAATAKCATPAEATALKVASVQQTLMNAGIGCGTNEAETKYWVANFNAFQTAFLTELRKSDALMLAMFKRLQGAKKGDASYNAFKTQVANNAGMRRVRAMTDFCKTAESIFAAVAAPDRPKLAEFIANIAVEDETPVETCPAAVATTKTAVVPVPRPRPALSADMSMPPPPMAKAPLQIPASPAAR